MLVFDSSTLILLAKIELLDIFLEHCKKEITIPKKVYEECTVKNAFDALLIKRRIEEQKITVTMIKNKHMKEKIAKDFNLGEGETEAIVLAIEKKAELIGLDDQLGINACKILGISFTTALALLIRTYEKKLITWEKAQAILAKLSYFGRYSNEILSEVKKNLGDTHV